MKVMKLAATFVFASLAFALDAAPAKGETVADGYPSWSGVSDKNYLRGRMISASDLRHRALVVIELDPAEPKLIEQLQKDNKGNAALQQSVADYQQQIASLQAKLAQQTLEYALRVKLMGEDAEDVDYLVYKALETHPEWREHPEAAMDEAGQIKGGDDIVAGLKTKHPSQFKAGQPAPKVVPQPLPNGDDRKPAPTNLAEALRQQYEPNSTN